MESRDEGLKMKLWKVETKGELRWLCRICDQEPWLMTFLKVTVH